MPKRFRKSVLRRVSRVRKTFEMPSQLRAHIRAVRRAAFSLAEALAQRGFKINPKVVSCAAWMHDLARNTKIRKRFGWHEPIGALVALNFFFFREARMILRHGLIPSKTKWSKFSLGQKVLVYADARVSGNKIVPLEERAKAVIARYKPGERLYDLHVQHYALLREFEEQLRRYGIDPDKL